jgi:NAD(P)-dependent dehydrogenase (short-subunit alcohol dehydrogenase family)
MAQYPLNGKVVFVTGAAGGIGSATSRALVGKGARVVLADLSLEAVERTLAVSVDVCDRASLDAAVEATIERFGGLDVMFANAGIAADPPATVLTIDEADFDRVIDVDLTGVWRTVRAGLPHVIERGGYVLLTASFYAFVNGLVNASYAAAKAGVEQLGRSLRTELVRHGASAGVLYPGWTKTPIAEVAFGGHSISTELARLAYPGPLGKQVTPEVIAKGVVRGIERRAPRIIVPKRWVPVSLLRGIVNPISDIMLERNDEMQDLVLKLEAETRERLAARSTKT